MKQHTFGKIVANPVQGLLPLAVMRGQESPGWDGSGQSKTRASRSHLAGPGEAVRHGVPRRRVGCRTRLR